MAEPSSAPFKRHYGRQLAVVTVALAVAAVATYVFWSRPTPPEPPPTDSAPLPPLSTSPFLNTKSTVAYVGDQTCAGCHRAQSKTYRQHPMGRSLFHAADAPPLEQYDATSNNPFQAGRFHFQVIRDGKKLIHKEWCQDAGGKVVAELQGEIKYAIGSGTQARSYLLQRDGFLFESPITWFIDKSGWRLSPGYDKHQLHFHRRIEPRCLYCHAQEIHPVADTVNRYADPPFGQLAIGCERCHGPGELHVAARKKGLPVDDLDRTIVNPVHLAPKLREAVCEQCHLQGEAIIARRGRSQLDYRPGLPLHEYVSIFVRPPEVEDPARIVGHVEQMHQSACFTNSGGKFGCISCHDPHGLPAPDAKVAFYRERCQSCHAPPAHPFKGGSGVKAPDCSLPVAKRTATDARDNCLTCHMPRNPSATTHLALTDHRVLRHSDRPRKLKSGFRPGKIPLLAFHRQTPEAVDEEWPRDLALATVPLAERARADGAGPLGDLLFDKVLPLLDRAVARDPHDVAALEARGLALFERGQPDEALKMLDRALARTPDREQTLTWAAEVALALGRLDLAEKHCRRLTEKYPYYPLHHERLAFLFVERKAWPQALEAARVAVKLDPFRSEARELLIAALLETGSVARAQTEFDALGVIDPDYHEKLRSRLATKGLK